MNVGTKLGAMRLVLSRRGGTRLSRVLSRLLLASMQADRDGEPSRRRSLDFSDLGDEDGAADAHPGDYSARMEELFDDDEDEHIRPGRTNGIHSSDDKDDEPFVYNGVDAEPNPISYRDQLRDVLDDESVHSEEDSDRKMRKEAISNRKVRIHAALRVATEYEGAEDCGSGDH